jgi:hypothetical protein
MDMKEKILLEKMESAKLKAIDSLSRYKFEMFGYWSSKWVGLNQLWGDFGNKKFSNPFRKFVQLAKEIK